MSVKNIIDGTSKKGYKMLSFRSDEVDTKKSGSMIREIILDLKDTIEARKLASLSANQIGYPYRILCINFNGEIRTFINPIITSAKGLQLSREVCPSLEGKNYIIPRNNQLVVLYQNPMGKTESRKFMGMSAVVMQHEINHLDGILLSDCGLEIDEDFDKATEEERQEVIDAYLKSLDLRQKRLEEEIENNEELKQISDAIDYMKAVETGEVKTTDLEIDR